MSQGNQGSQYDLQYLLMEMIFHGRNQFFRVDIMFSKNHSRKANHVSLIFLIAALYLASYESEGPENNMEKDRWKSLRCV